MSLKLTLSLLVAALAVAHGANILDIFGWDDKKLIEVPESRGDQPNRNCLCKGSACVCCVDFNITFVDLGGPGCVHMKYLSPEDGFSVNVSYGKNILHSSKIKGTNPAPVCLEVFGKFAQVCAKFSDLAPTADGLRGCLELEPRILGDSPLEFPVGCFKSTPGGMEMELATAKPDEPEATTESDNTDDDKDEDDKDEDDKDEEDSESEDNNGFNFIFTGIYHAAEEIVSGLFSLPNKLNATRPTTPEPTTAAPEETSPSETSQRSSKSLRHPNVL